jgi:beta-glucanase (GH16 family)
MKWRQKVAIATSGIGALVALGAGIEAAAPAAGTQTSLAAFAHGAERAARAVPRPPRGKPAFDATFRGTRLNTKIWDRCYPKLKNYRGGCRNWGNSEEREWYLPSQVRVSGGVVHLIARRRTTVGTTKTGKKRVYGCRSGMITSYPRFKFKYGFVQVVAKIPHAKGLWPALWLPAADGKYPPEIDMLESWGVRAETGSFFHPINAKRSRATYSPALTRGWQTYSVRWTRTRLRYYIGRRLVLTVRRHVPHQRMYFAATLAEYMRAKPGYCVGQLLIRSVKIWKA